MLSTPALTKFCVVFMPAVKLLLITAVAWLMVALAGVGTKLRDAWVV